MEVLTLPDLGEGLQHAEIVSWHVVEGEHVVTNQPLVAVETDKAVVDVPSPQSGTVTRLCAEVGDIVQVGAPLVEFGDVSRPDSGTVVGRLASAEPERAPPPVVAQQAPAGISASPRVRAAARELGVDLQSVRGSGPAGAILLSDVEQSATAADRGSDAQPLRGVRLAMAERMAAAHKQVVPASIHDDADVEDWPDTVDITWRLIRAVAAACAAEPALNAWFDSASRTRQLLAQVDLGMRVLRLNERAGGWPSSGPGVSPRALYPTAALRQSGASCRFH